MHPSIDAQQAGSSDRHTVAGRRDREGREEGREARGDVEEGQRQVAPVAELRDGVVRTSN